MASITGNALALLLYAVVIATSCGAGFLLARLLFPDRASMFPGSKQWRKQMSGIIVGCCTLLGVLSPVVYDYPRWPQTLVTANGGNAKSHPFGTWHRPFGSSSFVPANTLEHTVRIPLAANHGQSSVQLTFHVVVENAAWYTNAGLPPLDTYLSSGFVLERFPESLRTNPNACQPFAVLGVSDETLTKLFADIHLPLGTKLSDVDVTYDNVECCIHDCASTPGSSYEDLSASLPKAIAANNGKGILDITLHAKVTDVAAYIAHNRPQLLDIIRPADLRDLVPEDIRSNRNVCAPADLWLHDLEASALDRLQKNFNISTAMESAGVTFTKVEVKARDIVNCFEDGTDPIALRNNNKTVDINDSVAVPLNSTERNSSVTITMSGLIVDAVKYVQAGRPTIGAVLGNEAVAALLLNDLLYSQSVCQPLNPRKPDLVAKATARLQTEHHDSLAAVGIEGRQVYLSFHNIPYCLEDQKDIFEMEKNGERVVLRQKYWGQLNIPRQDSWAAFRFTVEVTNPRLWLATGRQSILDVLPSKEVVTILPLSFYKDTRVCDSLKPSAESISAELTQRFAHDHPDQVKKLADAGMTLTTIEFWLHRTPRCFMGTYTVPLQ